MKKLQFGMTVRDKITGFQGVLTGLTTYISGCSQGLVAPALKKNGTPREGAWFDVQRLEQVGTKIIVLDNSTTPGFDKAAPIR